MDVKIRGLESELSTYYQKMQNMREGPGRNALKARALKILRQKKQYDAQRDQLQQQAFNMEQTRMMQENIKHSADTVDVLRDSMKGAKHLIKESKVKEVEDLQSEMADIIEIQNEINESLSRAYNVPDGVEEDELDAELEALGEEAIWEQEQGIGQGNMPSYLQDEVPPQFVDEPPEPGKIKEAAGGIG